MAILDGGTSTANKANVDGNFNLQVRPPIVKEQTGFVGLAGIVDDGTVTAVVRAKRIDATELNHAVVAETDAFWEDFFGTNAQNSAKYRAPITTMTVTFAPGIVTINGGSITTINTNAAYQTYRTFPWQGRSEVRVNASIQVTGALQANCVMEAGLFAAVLPGAAVPTDGVFFRWTTAATLVGVVNNNGTEVATASMTVPSVNVTHDYQIVAHAGEVCFYIDGVLRATIVTQTAFPTLGSPVSAGALPFTVRQYIGGSAPGAANQLILHHVDVAVRGSDLGRPWAETQVGMGKMLSQGQDGGTMGTTALYSNSLAPGAGAAMTNTTAALGTGLGGQFAALPTLAANTDGILQSFQNPAGGVNQTPRNLVIKGVYIQGIVTTLIAGGPLLYLYSLAYGHTAVSMVTGEAATTKAPRRIPLGVETFPLNAPLGSLGQGVHVKFDAPILVAPGEFLAICAKNVGVVSSAGVVTWLVTYDGYFE